MSAPKPLDTADAIYKFINKELKSARDMRRQVGSPEYLYWEGQIDALLRIRAGFPKPEKTVRIHAAQDSKDGSK